MFSRLGRFTVRHRKVLLVVSGLAVVVSAMYGSTVADRLTAGGFEDPEAESSRAADMLEEQFGVEDPNLVLLVTADAGTVDDDSVSEAGTALTDELASEPDMRNVVSYWSLGNLESLRSSDGSQALVLGTIEGDDDEVEARVVEIAAEFGRDRQGIDVGVGGFAEVFREVGEQIEEDATKAELIAFPITLLLLVLVFGSVVAAGLPLAVGVIAVIGTLAVLQGLTAFTDVSIYSLNLTTAMGLGLAIDYSLFIVSRFREEMRRGLAPHDAVVRSVETAGKTVVFSAVTVAVSLSALLVFPLVFLRSFAYAGVAVALVAAVGSVVTLPALLAVLGTKVDALVLWRHSPKAVGEGFWHRLAMFVMRRPIPVATIVIAVLLFLGAPFLHVAFGLPDDRVLPADAASRQVNDQLRENFDTSESLTLSVVASETASASDETVDAYAAALSSIDGVARVDARTGSYAAGAQVSPPSPLSLRFVGENATWLSVVPASDVEANSLEGESLARAVRDEPAPFDVVVGGNSAELVDVKESLFSRMPLAAALIAVATFALLFLMFGGLLVPLKALVINLLSLTATFGAMVWIFQDGHLSGPLDFTATGTLDTTTPILMFCIAWGLSMDYEVFLLSRIKEEYDRTGDNTTAVAMGLERTGRIVTAAALLISIVMLAFATSSVTFIKLFGLGLALAVLMDAFVIRGTLVPALMRLAGRANWWAPTPLRRVYERFGPSEVSDDARLGAVSEADEPHEPARV